MYAYSRIEYENQVLDELIEKEMHTTRSNALDKLASVGAFQKEISLMIAYCWFDSLPDAIKVADDLDLGKLDFLAIQENFEEFKEEWLSNQREAQNF